MLLPRRKIEDAERIKKLTLRDSDSSAVKEKKKRTHCRGRERVSHGLPPDFTRINPSGSIGAIERQRVAFLGGFGALREVLL